MADGGFSGWRIRRRPGDHEHPVFVAWSGDDCERALRMVKNAPIVGVDTEFTDVNMRKQHPKGRARVMSLQLSTEENPHIFIPLWDEYADHLVIFKKWLEREERTKVLSNAKADMHVLANHDIMMRGLRADTQVLDFTYYHHDKARHALKELVRRYLDDDGVEDYSEVFRVPKIGKRGQELKTKWVPPLDEVVRTKEGIKKLIRYGVKDPWYSVRVAEYLENKLAKKEWSSRGSLLDYYRMFEVPFTETLFAIEQRGMPVDLDYLAEVEAKVWDDLVDYEAEFLHQCKKKGVPSHILENPKLLSSPKQLGTLFTEYLGFDLPRTEPTKTNPSGQPRVNAQTLRKSRKCKPIVEAYLGWKRCDKLRGTYVEPLQLIGRDYDGYIHTSYNQTGPVTGRLSSKNPNLQNQPKKADADTPETENKDPYGIRAAFVPEDDSQILIDADLSQIELRLMAHFSKDPAMLGALLKGWDLHSLTASKISHEVKSFVGVREITPELLKEVKARFPLIRDHGKRITFGTAYGMGPMKFAADTGQSVDEATAIQAAFMDGYPGLKSLIRSTHRMCREKGYVRTLLRRYIYLPSMQSGNFKMVKRAERQSFNFVIQGSGADLLKMSMILIERDEELKSYGCVQRLQVHDELLFTCPKKTKDRAKKRIEYLMSYPYREFGMKDLRLPTPASVGEGENWMEAK